MPNSYPYLRAVLAPEYASLPDAHLDRVVQASTYGYGTVHDRAALDRALAGPTPYAALGYHPSVADRDGRGAHVMGIAAAMAARAGRRAWRRRRSWCSSTWALH